VALTNRGLVPVDKQMRTNVVHIFAIGDIVGQPMLAHKAVQEAHVAAEVAAGHKAFFDAPQIPSVTYTDPEIHRHGGGSVRRGLHRPAASKEKMKRYIASLTPARCDRATRNSAARWKPHVASRAALPG
jgi:pyruvate/2-oxoglutarate dehydrogenase complex dihydrolipoamide dehydrogenase (E3) component